MDIILASASPRRSELLKQIGVSFRVLPSNAEEGQLRPPWTEGVQALALQKALAVQARPGEIVLAADTIVVHCQEVLGKPGSVREAAAMLRRLSGSWHEVMTGICVACYKTSTPRILQDVEVTKVSFRTLTEREIEYYAASGEPSDKAGAYGIQGLGALLVSEIQGCYDNVVGLPLVRTMHLLRSCGVPLLGVSKDEEADRESYSNQGLP